jgi:hypothetical protein
MPDNQRIENPQVQHADAPGPETLKLVLSWIFVGVPALWGVSQVFVKSLALFKR